MVSRKPRIIFARFSRKKAGMLLYRMLGSR